MYETEGALIIMIFMGFCLGTFVMWVYGEISRSITASREYQKKMEKLELKNETARYVREYMELSYKPSFTRLTNIETRLNNIEKNIENKTEKKS